MKPLSCPNPDCRVAETGKCVEGFQIGECPHQSEGIVDVDPEIPNNSPMDIVSDENHNETYIKSGEILKLDEAVDILCSGPTIILNIIGPTDSGKTTLGISLYDAFQDGPFGEWNFCGSQTLVAFEKRCHDSRAKCGRNAPETERTSLSTGLGFLHISIHSHNTGNINLLISDRSGEYYRSVVDNLEECGSLFEVIRADCVLYLIDGKSLASDDRHGVVNDFIMTMETLIEGGVIGVSHRIGIVLTKYDLVLASENKIRVENDFERLIKKYEERFSQKVKETKIFKIAARSANEEIESRYGILDLLKACTIFRSFNSSSTPTRIASERIFQNLKII